MKQLKSGERATIMYTSASKGETTKRVIIPSYVPNDSIKALDVSELTEAEQLSTQLFFAEYVAYQEERRATSFTFEDWLQQTHNVDISAKWRTFKLGGIINIE